MEVDRMAFCWCTLEVDDMEKSLQFYQEIVGLPLDRRFKPNSGMEISFLGDGETKVELICREGNEAKIKGEGVSLGFTVDSLDKKIEFIKEKGIAVASGPVQPNPHLRFFFVSDPDGFQVQFVENM